MAVTAPMDTRTASFDRVRARVSPTSLAAFASFAIAAVVYYRTLLPGVSFGDWAESELLLSRLGILHPTGYPFYSIVGKLFSLIPIGSVALRANALSATAAALTVGVAVLIAVRLGVRPAVAMAAALALAFTGTLWEEATFSEMNTLHLLLVALLLHRALVWRDERRTRDLLIGALIAGLCVSNHALAISVVPIVILFVLVDARREILARPVVLVQSFLAFGLGLLPYLYLPLRALAGPDRCVRQVRHPEGLLRPRQRRPVPPGHALPVGRQRHELPGPHSPTSSTSWSRCRTSCSWLPASSGWWSSSSAIGGSASCSPCWPP